MADTNTIGSASDYTVYLGDGAAGSSVYACYLKPENIKMKIQTPATIQEMFDLGNTIIKQLGKIVVIFAMRNIVIDTFAEFEKFKKALTYWSTGNGGTFGGELLTFQAKDKNGNEWSKVAAYSTPETLATVTVKTIKPIELEPLPSGKFIIRYLEVIRCKSLTDVEDE